MELKISKKYKLIEDIHLASGIKYFFYKEIDFPYIHIFRGLTEFQITEVRYPLNVFYHSYVNINNKKVKYENLKYKDCLEYLYFLFFISKIYCSGKSSQLFKNYEI